MATNGIDFVIGARNQAAPAFTETEKGLNRLQAGTKRLEGSTKSLMSAMAPLIAVLAAVKTVMAAVGGVRASNEAFDKQTEAVLRLNRALQIRGAEAHSQQLQTLAADLQKLTGVGDEVTIGLMQTAASMEFATDRIDDATKAAIGLSEATGKTAEQSLGDLKSALEGNFDAFIQVNPQIRYMRSNQERLAAVLAIANQGLTAASENMATAAGSSKRASGAFGDLLEKIGALIEPLRVMANTTLMAVSESLQSLLAPAVEYVGEAMAKIGPLVQATIDYFGYLTESVKAIAGAILAFVNNALLAVFGPSMERFISVLSDGGKMMEALTQMVVWGMNKIITAFTFVEVAITNLSDVWELMTTRSELSMESTANVVEYYLTDVIPGYATWFRDNFVALINDAFSGILTVIQNGGEAAADMVGAIVKYIASGGAGGIDGLMANLGQSAGRSLTEGFKSTLTDLPDIAARKLSQREQDLADKLKAVGGRLGDAFTKKLQERLLVAGKALGIDLADGIKDISLKGRPVAVMQGIQATEGRLLTRGPASNYQTQMLDLMKKAVESQKGIRQKITEQDVVNREQRDSMVRVAENTSKSLMLVPIL